MNQELEDVRNQIKSNIRLLINNNKIEEAEELLEEYFKIDNNDVETYSMKGVINILKENYAEAEIILKEGNKVNNEYFDIHYNLAYVEELLGKFEEASFYYNLALQLCNDDNIKIDLRKKLDYLKDEFNINMEDINKKYCKDINLSIKKVLFIQNVPCIRTNKVARALHEKGIQVDIAYLALHPADVYKDIELPYTNIYKIENINFTINFINDSDYDILYSSNEPDYLTVLFTATNKPIVHDTHDMMSLRADITVEQTVHEYIANVKSNGNIYVNPSIRDIAVKKFNLVNKPILSLHSFIEKEQLPNKYLQKLSAKDNEIHCVFEGGLNGVPGHHRFLESIFLKLAKNKIHIHLHCPVDGEYLKTLLKKSKYIHYEGVTSPKNLIVEMTKYDVGLAIFNLNERNKLFLDTAFPNKIWDYLAAGLPILFADLASFKQFAKESNVGKVLDINGDIKKQIEEVSKIYIDRNILKNNKWIMNEVGDEIIDFFKNVKEKYNFENGINVINNDIKYENITDNIKNTYNEFKNKKNDLETNYRDKLKAKINDEVKKNNIDKAIDLIIEFEKYDDKDREIILIKVDILIKKHKIKEAKIILKDSFDNNCADPDYLYYMSFINGQENNISEATKYFAHAQMIAPSNIKITEVIPKFNKKVGAKENKILLGPIDIANQLNVYSKGLRKKGFETTNLSYVKKVFDFEIDKFVDISKYGSSVNQLSKTKEVSSEMISEYDIFHFIYGRSLALDCSDLPLYSKLNKKVVMSFMGSDVRQYSKAVKLNPYWKLIKDDYFGKLGLLDEEKTKRHIEFLAKHIKDGFVDYELYEYVKNDFNNIHFVKAAVDITSISFSGESNNIKPIIVHAPSNLAVKGTKFILKAIEELKEKYDFEFITVQNMKHEDAMKIYQKADIIIDQIIAGGYGVFAIESMAMGKSVICWISDFMKSKYPKELPIVSANPDNIKEKIELLLKDSNLRKELGINGRKYVEKHHNVDNVVEDFINVYKQ